jgi:predicted permease
MAWRFRLPASRQRLARELDDELALHLELRTRALERQGHAPQAARLEAERRFGDQSAIRDDCLAIDEAHHATHSRWNAVGEFAQDVRYAARALVRDRRFTLLTAGIFALGIGAATALFSVYDAVVLRPLDVPAPERVMWATMRNADGDDGVSPALWFAWSERARSFLALARVRTTASTLTGRGVPTRVEGLLVSEGFFPTLDVPPTLGRRLDARDYMDGAEPVVVIGTSLWRQQFGSDSAIVGGAITLDGTLRTVVGILPPAAEVLGAQSAFWLPERLAEDQRTNPTPYLAVVGRLRDGVSIATAGNELHSILTALDTRSDRDARPVQAHVIPLADYLTAPFRDRVLLLLVAVLALLFIGAVNVANLLMARGAARTREMALRASLGASRGRLVRQLFTEHLLLSVIGGVAGITLGVWLMQALVAVLPADLPRVQLTRLNGASVLVAVGLTVLAALVAGLLPAWRAAAVDLRGALQDGGRGATSGASHDRLRRSFVVAEMAMTVVLLVAAGLLVRSADALGRVDPGFTADGVITARYALPPAAYPGAAEVQGGHARVLAAVRSQLGDRTALASKVPLDGNGGGGSGFLVFGTSPGKDGEVNAALRLTTPGYLATMGLALVQGRDFTDADRGDAARVVIISEGLARRLGIDGNALGTRVAGTSSPFLDSTGTPFPWEVVGVVRDPRDWGLRNDPQPQVFIPLTQTPAEIWQWAGREVHVVARSAQPVAAVRTTLAAAVAQVDPTLALYDVQTMRQRLRASLALERANTILLGALGIAALLLAVTGLYGVVGYAVQQRGTEFGVRLALGATPRDLVILVGRWSARLAGVGVAAGIPLALLVAWALRGLLYGVGSFDLVTLGAASLLVAVVAGVSALVPARRAARTAPNSVLRG